MPAPNSQFAQLDPAGKRRALALIVLYPVLAAGLFAIGFALLYPRLFPAQARRTDDPIGYWIGTLGIPGIAVVGMALGRRRLRAELDARPPEL